MRYRIKMESTLVMEATLQVMEATLRVNREDNTGVLSIRINGEESTHEIVCHEAIIFHGELFRQEAPVVGLPWHLLGLSDKLIETYGLFVQEWRGDDWNTPESFFNGWRGDGSNCESFNTGLGPDRINLHLPK
jgi:hypothetical protein